MVTSAGEKAMDELRKAKLEKLSVERYVEKSYSFVRRSYTVGREFLYQWF